jgi:hypothetical protein
MLAPIHSPTKGAPHRIEINLHDLNQLFNTLDPSPFYEKDLDDDAEEFIVSWAREFPLSDPVILCIHLEKESDPAKDDEIVQQAVQHYFEYRGKLVRLEFRRLMREGRISLIIGLVFLVACLTSAQLIAGLKFSTVRDVSSEGLTILGWVAMWRPLQIYLYDWWPLRRRWKVAEKLSKMKVHIYRPK